MNTNTTIRVSRTNLAKTVVAAVMVAAGALVPTVGSAGPVEDVEQRCLANASGSADSLERWVDHCREVSGEFLEAYHGCMLDAPGSADSLERWVDHCAVQSADAVDTG